MRKLVAYFSASGTTARVAERLADAIDADVFEIAPLVSYTRGELNWMDRQFRNTIKMQNPGSRPAITTKKR